MTVAGAIQKWWCEKCVAKGAVIVADGEGVYAVLDRIHDDHKRESPRCADSRGHAFIRVAHQMEVEG